MIDKSNLKTLLDSPDTRIEDRLSILETTYKEIQSIVDIAVNSLSVSGESRLYVAERIFMFGSIAIQPLHNLFQSTTELHLKFTIALLLLRLGDQVYIEVVIEALTKKGFEDDVCLIARAVANAGMIEYATNFTNKVITTNSLDEILCILSALQKMDCDIPTEVRIEICNDIHQRLKNVKLDDFSEISKSVEIASMLTCSLDHTLIRHLKTVNSNKMIFDKFGL